ISSVPSICTYRGTEIRRTLVSNERHTPEVFPFGAENREAALAAAHYPFRSRRPSTRRLIKDAYTRRDLRWRPTPVTLRLSKSIPPRCPPFLIRNETDRTRTPCVVQLS